MIDAARLFQLESGQKRRKLALMLGEIEREEAGAADETRKSQFKSARERRECAAKICALVAGDPKILDAEKSAVEENVKSGNTIRACNFARNALLRILQISPADWNMVVAPHDSAKKEREFWQGTFTFLEDIRSPFNLGSIFRTAEAFGAEKLFLSPLCCPPEHHRAERSAMGCTKILPFERRALCDLPADIPIFALETGGTPIDEFEFPERAVALIGNEELGLSPAALKAANAGIVSIPLVGTKASLNVAVAFGILMQKWSECLRSRRQSA